MDLDAFIARWTAGDGGAERANYALFLSELCDVIGVERPQPASADAERNDYVFERFVRRPDGSNGRIDLYKRDAFVLEAKQSRQSARTLTGEANDKYLPDAPRQASLDLGLDLSLAPADAASDARGRRGARRGWDVLMINARGQAEDYARHLPQDHGWPPFVIVCDVGHSLELFADFRRMGKYEQFPDRQRYRIYLADLRDAGVRDLLRQVWTDPYALDPSKRAAKTTREIARRLAEVTKALEAKRANAEDVAHFLMRCIFTMFAEDWRLLPENSFTRLLERSVEDPAHFPRRLKSLWATMETGGWSDTLDADVRRFNGGLFKDTTAFELGREEIAELLAAARADWREVEPAIFGTLLEQALDPRERKKLGAHYTPRAYVERLVTATIIDPLREDWAVALAAAEERRSAGDAAGAVAAVQGFHDRLCETRVLDPACGTGNFLYVSLELMKRLEGEVLEALADLGGQEALTGLEGHTVDPHQFLGLELNPRAAAIAELVLWIGYLQQHFRTNGAAPGDPVLKAFNNINFGRPGGYDALLTWDGWPVLGGRGGRKALLNPRRPEWPQADFIVGNPPFVANREFRELLSDAYVEALKATYVEFNQAADLVLLFWIRATQTKAQAIGFVSTARLTMKQNNLVFRGTLNGWRIAAATPDHEWPNGDTMAKVRVCFVTLDHERGPARLTYAPDHHVVKGRTHDPDGYRTALVDIINSDLTSGTDHKAAQPLRAAEGMLSAGVKPYSQGLLVDEKTRNSLFPHQRDRDKLAPVFMNGHDVGQHWRGNFVLDLNDLNEHQLRAGFPLAYSYVLEEVRPARSLERNPRLRTEWWKFEANRSDLRRALDDLPRYIVTLENIPQRYFTFLSNNVLPDQKLRVTASSSGGILAILSSSLHTNWTLRVGGRAGQANTPVYNTDCFVTFPFPDPSEPLRAELRAAGEELDAFRKARQAEHPRLTLTQMYNVREAIRAGRALTPDEARIKDEGLVLILNELHDRIDRLTFDAYGWPHDLSDEAMLERLVALNKERAAEERRGIVRWLRPDYQKARAGVVELRPETAEMQLDPVAAKTSKPAFPTGLIDQGAAVAAALLAASAPVDASAIAAGFKQGKRAEPKVAAILAAMARTGAAATRDGGRTFQARRAA